MAILKVSRLGHPILLQKCEIVDDITGIETKKIIKDMTETMLDAKGIGLAAPQVYIKQKIMIFINPDEKSESETKIETLINPKLIKVSDETNDDWEGCLSIPGMLGLVRRFSQIRYQGFDMFGNTVNIQANGLHARVIQHEYDHLMGILYINRLAHKNAYGYTDEIKDFWQDKEVSLDER